MEFPFKKWTQFRDLEVAGNKRLVDPQRLRKEYLENFHKFCRQLRERPAGCRSTTICCAPMSRSIARWASI
jgi:spore germination protein YaaH